MNSVTNRGCSGESRLQLGYQGGSYPQLSQRGYDLKCFLHVCVPDQGLSPDATAHCSHTSTLCPKVSHPSQLLLSHSEQQLPFLLTPSRPHPELPCGVSVYLSCFWSIRKCPVLPRVWDAVFSSNPSACPTQLQPQYPLPSSDLCPAVPGKTFAL